MRNVIYVIDALNDLNSAADELVERRVAGASGPYMEEAYIRHEDAIERFGLALRDFILTVVEERGNG